jgi:long-chain acyl-CoA synthetase
LHGERKHGVVGFPIPGVEIKLGSENEILVRGPNVMRGYFKDPLSTVAVLSADGWFATGDVGGITRDGLKIVSRKDRMFKLSNGEKVFPSVLEERIKMRCKFVKHAYVFGRGYTHPMVLIFANQDLYGVSRERAGDGCGAPGCAKDFSECLKVCLGEINESFARFERICCAAIILSEPSIEEGELTPSFKLVPTKIHARYQHIIDALENGRELPEGSFLVELEDRGVA